MTRGRGVSNAVLDVLTTLGRPMSIGAIAQHVPFAYKQVTDACARLARDGVISKVKRGVYHYRTDPVTIEDHLNLEQEEDDRRERDYDERQLPVPSVFDRPDLRDALTGQLYTPEPVMLRENAGFGDKYDLPTSPADDVDVVMDMLFPERVSIHRAIEIAEWRSRTCDLIVELRRDAD